MYIELVELNDNVKEVYRFLLLDNLDFVFTSYHKTEKQPRKRLYRLVDKWDRLNLRSSNIAEPILTDLQRSKALDLAIAQLKIKTLNEYKN
jgi:hypothetical protein